MNPVFDFKDDKAFVENTARINIMLDGKLISFFSAHPNMVVLPSVGDLYTMQVEQSAPTNIPEISGIVSSVGVRHKFAHTASGSVTMNQVISINCKSESIGEEHD